MGSYLRVSNKIPLTTARTCLPYVFSATRTDTYPVYACRTEPNAVTHLLQEIDGRRVAIITDHNVASLHAPGLARRLREHHLDVAVASFPPGESSKSVTTAVGMFDWLARSSIARRDIVLAVGGGAVIDTVGWIASAYMRGVPYINVPTTLLAHVDAALGGKVAVNHVLAKNLIGAFYQPKAVVSNVGYLSTLSPRQIAAGLAEVIKKAVIASPELFVLIEGVADDVLDLDLLVLEDVVRAASVVKCALISRDPYEEDLRRPLNFGHTVGHAVETVTGYAPVLHGEAVAYGMTVAAQIALRRGLLQHPTFMRLVRLLQRVKLPITLSDFAVTIDPAEVVSALDQIRKIRDGSLRFVLPTALGETVIADDVTDDEVRAAMLCMPDADAILTPVARAR